MKIMVLRPNKKNTTTKAKAALSLCLISILFMSKISTNKVEASALELLQMLLKIEEDTAAFAHHMEDLIRKKCDFSSDDTCYKASYHACDSEFPSAMCPGNEYSIKQCGSQDSGCGGLFDFSTSVVSVAPDTSSNLFGGSVTTETINDSVRDGVCSTLRLEQYMKDRTESSKAYWDAYNVFPPSMYYGTDDGVFRMYPATPSECPNGQNVYNPTIRPWYVAASSGPKDVILVLDTSGSMRDYDRINIMKKAAKRVVNTLGAGDFFTVIEFNSYAKVIGNHNLMVRATKENKEDFEDYISSLSAGGGTNFKVGFELAFKTFEDSVLQDRSSSCNRAILFLTDGVLADSESELMSEIQTERSKYTNRGQRPPVIFTYSLGSGADDRVPKDIACQNDGIWSQINDGGDLAKSMGAYYKYFAYGLGNAANEDFVAWVEPYEYSTGVGMGTTASAPVFDHTVDPPVLAGVVGMDISFAALEQAFGERGGANQDQVIQQVIQRSGAVCPKIELNACQLESLRKYGSDDEGNESAICGNRCSGTIPQLQAPLCQDYATELWDNDLNKGHSYEERTCCHVGSEPRIKGTLSYEEIKDNHVCKETKPNIALIVGLSVPAGIIGLCIIGFFIRCCIKINREKSKQEESRWSSINQEIKPLEEDMVIMPHPTAPEATSINHSLWIGGQHSKYITVNKFSTGST